MNLISNKRKSRCVKIMNQYDTNHGVSATTVNLSRLVSEFFPSDLIFVPRLEKFPRKKALSPPSYAVSREIFAGCRFLYAGTKGLDRERLLRPRNFYVGDVSQRPHEKLSSPFPKGDQKKVPKVNSSTFGLAHRTMVTNVALSINKALEPTNRVCLPSLANISFGTKIQTSLYSGGDLLKT